MRRAAYRASYGAVAVLLAVLVFNPGRTSLPPIDRDEPRYAQATAQMLETKDFVDVRYLDTPRYLQPAGIYWLQALAVTVFGTPGVRDIGVNRLVSLGGATAALFVTAEIGAMAFGEAAGLVAMALLASTTLLGFEARLATIDATLLAVVLAAQASLLRVYLARDAGVPVWHALTFWAALGVGVMLKGPVILLVSFGTLAALAAVERRVGWWARLRPGLGAMLVTLIAAPWLIAIGLKSHGAFFQKSVGDNFLGKVATGQQAHFGWPGFHVALFVLLAGGAYPFAVRAAPGAWALRRTPAVRFMLCWIAPTWLTFELIATKLPHYVLPTYPALVILAAGCVRAPISVRWRRWAYRPLCGLWLVAMAALAFGPLTAVVALAGMEPGEVVARAALGVVGLGFAALVLRLLPSRAAAGCAAVMTAALSLGAYRTLPLLKPVWIAPRVAALVDQTKPCPEASVASASFSEPSLVFLLGTQTRLMPTADAAAFLADAPACRLALIGTRDRAVFDAALADRAVTVRDLGHVTGITLSTGRPVDLGLYSAAEP